MIRTLALLAVTAPICFGQTSDKPESRPINALIITGGCCHDYAFQTAAMMKAAADRKVPVKWTVVQDGGTGIYAVFDD